MNNRRGPTIKERLFFPSEFFKSCARSARLLENLNRFCDSKLFLCSGCAGVGKRNAVGGRSHKIAAINAKEA